MSATMRFLEKILSDTFNDVNSFVIIIRIAVYYRVLTIFGFSLCILDLRLRRL